MTTPAPTGGRSGVTRSFRHRKSGAWALGGLGAIGVALLLIPGSMGSPVASYRVARLSITTGGVTVGQGKFVNCTSAVSGNHGYVCFSAQLSGTNGYARGWQ